jgi:hypothetical protein
LEGDKIGAGICLQQSEPRLPCRDPQRVDGILPPSRYFSRGEAGIG